MKFTTIIGLFGLAQLVLCDKRGSYTVPGLGERKQALLKAGGNTMDMAIAMLESDHMKADYVYGDGKSGDATNFGIFKQNWMMLRTSARDFQGQSVEQVSNGAVLNHNLKKDVKARHDGEKHYGFDTWFAGHRNGASGLQNPHTDDINTYKSAVQWIKQQIESDPKYQKDDTRFYVDVMAI
ncbi:hypothetical protein IFM61606_03099 [Aspergillus udagawae]|uniref:Uncharacterized protein n=1 Tax=Aspergillus udagawae TaxID=91492 RepID=A0A8H3PA23_9EURO|nr:uncharacterized protein Aud_010868 [Aspergillus udagawae]GFF35030.1 hypothetical protein IFM51744_02646 [Aspergillus udagawae]GFF45923.1 hypothetical protein IFM46972_07914 [Aspergillus udagawae]GFF82860.1 hypothetical protein IFM53868_03617 [Aspergillus udagawae]GFG00842.1 hypothetical protein IFM5058_00194 [Aspergillus udagawae]GFG23223.1 hypothetical protein IFM61606_03099 [Aspergillus udagawae]